MSMTAASRNSHQRHTAVVSWVRKTHGWIGLWGAILGLIFGTAGIWLNHRAVLKLPVSQERSNAQLALPDTVPASAAEMAEWLQSVLGQRNPPNFMRIEPSRPVTWTEQANGHAVVSDAPKLVQPEHWTFNFGGPDEIVQADYWRGNRSLGVTTTSNGFIATLNNLHKGTGMPVAWILLVDTLAGSIIFLSISGFALWMLTHRRRRMGLAIFGTSAVVTLGLIASRVF